MAYDPNDAEDKKIVAKLVKEALEEQAAEHETDIKGLKAKNSELVDKLKKASEGKPDAAEVVRLELELETSQAALKTAQKEFKSTKTKLDEVSNELGQERISSNNLLIDTNLTEALGANKVATQFMPAVKALLRPQAVIKTEADGKKVFVGDKSLGDFVKDWAQGDQGKAFVSANYNSGVDAQGNKVPFKGNDLSKTMSRAEYESLSQSDPAKASKFFVDGGQLLDAQ